MIAFLSGKVVAVFANYIILRLPSGVGYLVQVSPARAFMVNESVDLFILEVFRDNRPELFGFSELKEREWVEKLLKVDGVGPKTAATVVYVLGWEGLAQAIKNNDVKTLAAVKGLGSKTAKKVILELKTKEIEVQQLEEAAFGSHQEDSVSVFAQTLSNLGYKRNEIVGVISKLKAEELWNEKEIASMIKHSLKYLAKK